MLNCILLIDDDRVSNYISENVIRSVGAASMINTVTDGLAAIEYIKYQCSPDNSNYACPDLIILDMDMRLMNGLEFVKEMDDLHLLGRIPIIILSAAPMKKDEMDLLKKYGITHFYVKPMTAEHLIEAIENISHVA